MPQGGQVEKRRVEAGTLQPASAEVEDGHAAVSAGDALPTAAVGAGTPRREGACGIAGGEGTPQPEQRRGLVRMALDLCWWHGSLVAVGAEGVGELDRKEQVNEQGEEELLAVAGMGDRHC